ncbi:MAG: hypothetical protein LBE03_02790 [Candidatus Nomurabacteria bacterium]|jgi:hypothetical protein|nr:hypothetical protein [Candidatus Nomurabacteria bacterium]
MDNQNQQQPQFQQRQQVIAGRKEDLEKRKSGIVSKVIIGVLSVMVLVLGGVLAVTLIEKDDDKETVSGSNMESGSGDEKGVDVVDEGGEVAPEEVATDPLEPFYNVLAEEGYNVKKIKLGGLEDGGIKNSSVTPYQIIEGNIGYCDENRENCDGGAAVHFWREGADDDWHFGYITQGILECDDYIEGFVGRKATKAFADNKCLDNNGKTVVLRDNYTWISDL